MKRNISIPLSSNGFCESDIVSEDSIYDEGCSSHIHLYVLFYIVLGYTPHTLTTILKQTVT